MKFMKYLLLGIFSIVSITSVNSVAAFKVGPSGMGHYSGSACLTCSKSNSSSSASGRTRNDHRSDLEDIFYPLLAQDAARYRSLCTRAIDTWQKIKNEKQEEFRKIENIKTHSEAFVAELAMRTGVDLKLVKTSEAEFETSQKLINKLLSIKDKLLDVYFESEVEQAVCRLNDEGHFHSVVGCWNSQSEPIYSIDRGGLLNIIAPPPAKTLPIIKVQLTTGKVAEFQGIRSPANTAYLLESHLTASWRQVVETELKEMNGELRPYEIRDLINAYKKGEACPE